MYISKIRIKNYKCFKESEIEFRDGLNVILGHNNGGKSTLLDAFALVIDSDKSKRLSAWDFHQGFDLGALKQTPPSVEISLYISLSDNEDYNSSDVALFSSYATELSPKLESCLTYVFYLPNSAHQSYQEIAAKACDTLDVIKIIENNFIRK